MITENLRPFQNFGGFIRRIFDLQVASTYRGILPHIRSVTKSHSGRVLDVGCGACPYRSLFPSTWEYIGLDIESATENFDYERTDIFYYDGTSFPFENGSMDLVFHSEVLEHVYDCRHFLSECHRVLKNNGKLLFTVPFQARWHYIPFDYWRFTPSCITLLLEESGFTNITVEPRSGDICVAAYKVLGVGYRLFFSRCLWRMILSILLAPIWVLSLLIGQISLHLRLGATEDALGYTIFCEKPNLETLSQEESF